MASKEDRYREMLSSAWGDGKKGESTNNRIGRAAQFPLWRVGSSTGGVMEDFSIRRLDDGSGGVSGLDTSKLRRD